MIPKRVGVKGMASVIVSLVATHAAMAVSSPPPPSPTMHDGRYFEVVIADKITWEAARAAAEQRTHLGVRGQLATILSAAEDAFVDGLLRAAVTDGAELWVGGYQEPCTSPHPEPGCGWVWINGVAIAASNTDSPYTHWLPGQPDNTIRIASPYALPSEKHLAIGLGGGFGWNDEGYLPHIRGFVVEYGDKVTVPAATCTHGGAGCNPTGAQVLQYPEKANVAQDATLSARTFRMRDDPSRCGAEPLILFDGAVVIPPYLCGHPEFLVIETEAVGVEVFSGAVLVENLTEHALPNNLYGCTAVRQNPAGAFDPDPSHRDVVAWQSSDPAEMLESHLGTGRFFGTLAEVTYACGSSRGKVLAGSYHFVGLRIHPGAGNEYADNPVGNHQSFAELSRYKLELLRAAVDAAARVLPGASYVALRAHVKNAIRFHDRADYVSALSSIKSFLKEVDQSKYRPVEGANPGGEHTMRASNIEYIYEQKLIPYSQ